ncbi:hypothetical protein, partial [Accumulibacter sp.]|uniref:hypothetical protein n=1 Tax=Accumulibacter sp. TaxID=2053492 RepID=UPI0028C4C235
SKRTTMFGVDAQVGGLLALRILEKEIKQGGFGLTGNAAMMCPVIKQYYSGGGGVTTTVSTLPVRITDTGGTTPDIIDTFYSGSALGAAPLHITLDMPTPSNKTNVNTVNGLGVCDFVLFAAPDGSKQCSLLQVTDTKDTNPGGGGAGGTAIFFLTGSGQSNYNPPGGAQTGYFPAGGYDTNDVIINMGSFTNLRLQVAKTAGADEYFLRQTTVPNSLGSGASACAGAPAATPTADLVGNVVDIQARYGVAGDAVVSGVINQNVDCWTDAVDLTAVATGPDTRVTGPNNSYCYGKNWANLDASAGASTLKNRIKAVRVAVAVRSALPEQPAVPGGACDTTTAAPVGWAGGPTMSGVTAVANWQCYRYKVYQTITPLVNVIWAKS